MNDYSYKVETHLHTSQASACAVSTGAQMARFAKYAGYCAIVVTDHFFNGNTAIRGNYSWDDKITMFVQGYKDAKQEGDKVGIDVYFGFEYGYHGAEFLIYNYGEEKLRAYPEIMTDPIGTVLTNIRNDGGFVIHAHPFRTASYIQDPNRIFPEYIDAVEVINIHNSKEANRRAYDYAEHFNLIKFSGSDTHSIDLYEGGLAFPRCPKSIDDIIEMARNEECMILGEQYL
jgi:predicted metal-dependent phosphoesterase TrpH